MTSPADERPAFLILLRSHPERWDELPAEGVDADLEQHATLVEELRDRGALIACSPLVAPREGREVLLAGEVSVSPEKDEWPIAGFYLVRCEDREEAIRVAGRIPDARVAPATVRQLMPLAAITEAGGAGRTT